MDKITDRLVRAFFLLSITTLGGLFAHPNLHCLSSSSFLFPLDNNKRDEPSSEKEGAISHGLLFSPWVKWQILCY
jgi:hypothetical protein